MNYRPGWWDDWCLSEKPFPSPEKIADAVAEAMNSNKPFLDYNARSTISYHGVVMIGALPPFLPHLIRAVESTRAQ